MDSPELTGEDSLRAPNPARDRQLSDTPSSSSVASRSTSHHDGRNLEEADSSFLLGGAGYGGREAEAGGGKPSESFRGFGENFHLVWRFLQRFCRFPDIERRILWIISGPAIAGLVLIFCGSMSPNQNVSRMLAALLWMAVWWLTEALPIAVTSLLPLVLFPFLQIMEASEVAKSYVNDTIVLFIGSFMLALCVEKYNVHKRIALKLLLLLRSKEKKMDPRLVLLGFCLAPGFISMWINNTATAIMMVPMAVGVLHRVQSSRKTSRQQLELSEEEERVNCLETMEAGRISKVRADSDELSEEEMRVSGVTRIRVDRGNRAEGSSAVAFNNGKHSVEAISFQEDNYVPEEESRETMDPERNDFGDSVVDRDVERRFGKGGKRAENMTTFEIETGKGSDVRWREGHDFEECIQNVSEDPSSSEEYIQNFSKGVVLAIAYSASIGGMATIIGTGPNLVLAGVWRHLFPEAPPITFMDWFMFGFPLSITFLLVLWAMLSFWYCPSPAVPVISASLDLRVMEEEYAQLGPISFAERVVLLDFGVLAFLWMTRSLGGHSEGAEEGEGGGERGWSNMFHDMVDDGTAAMAAALILFVIPSRRERERGEQILEWKMVGQMPWDIVVLLGGGFSLSTAVSQSGLSSYIGDHLSLLHSLPTSLLVPSLSLLVVFCTEFSSNSATATIFLPLLAHVSLSLNLHPLLLLLPSTISCSFAFMLPIATPPNAIAYSTGFLKMRDMAIPGGILNIVGIGLLSLFVFTLGDQIWDLDEKAENLSWVHFQNSSSPSLPFSPPNP